MKQKSFCRFCWSNRCILWPKCSTFLYNIQYIATQLCACLMEPLCRTCLKTRDGLLSSTVNHVNIESPTSTIPVGVTSLLYWLCHLTTWVLIHCLKTDFSLSKNCFSLVKAEFLVHFYYRSQYFSLVNIQT